MWTVDYQRNSYVLRGKRPTAKTSWFNTTVTPEQESAEDRLGQNVQNSVEHSLGVGRDDVTTLGESPGNRVEEPEEGGPRTDGDVGSRDISANGSCVLTASPDECPDDPKESDTSKGEVSPLHPPLAAFP